MFCRFAREKRFRLWKDYVPSAPIVPIQNKEFTGKVSRKTKATVIAVYIITNSPFLSNSFVKAINCFPFSPVS